MQLVVPVSEDAIMSSATAASPPPTATPADAAASTKGKGREKPLASLLAGTTAGAIEGFVTYPTEFAKTRLQFANDLAAKRVVASDGMGGVGTASGAPPKVSEIRRAARADD